MKIDIINTQAGGGTQKVSPPAAFMTVTVLKRLAIECSPKMRNAYDLEPLHA